MRRPLLQIEPRTEIIFVRSGVYRLRGSQRCVRAWPERRGYVLRNVARDFVLKRQRTVVAAGIGLRPQMTIAARIKQLSL